jgi:hypothetical protein
MPDIHDANSSKNDVPDGDKTTGAGANAWSEFFEMAHGIDVPDDFMADRPLNVPPKAIGGSDD